LRKDETLKLRSRERALPVKDDQAEILLQRQLSILESLKGQMMPFIDLCQVQLKGSGGSPAGLMIPSVCEQYLADIQKQAGNRRCFLRAL
jgi:hypothetical protein